MKKRLLPLPMLAVMLMAMPAARAQNITDTGPGSFSDIDNTGTLDYVLINNGASIGNVTNDDAGILNNNNAPTITTCCGVYTGSLTVDGSTVTGNITNNGTISQTNDSNNAAGILLSNASSIGGAITNNGAITIATPGSGNTADGVLIDIAASITGDFVNGMDGTITATAGDGGGAFGIDNNFGTIAGNLTNSGIITATAGSGASFAFSVVNDGTITGSLTNSGTIMAAAGNGGASFGIFNGGTITGGITNTGTITAMGSNAVAIYSAGSALTINQNAGSINGEVGLSGADTFNINGGTVTGSITGNVTNIGQTDVVNLTGGTLRLLGGQSVTAIGTYTQGASGNLVFQISTLGTGSGLITATTINLDGTLVVSPQGGGYLTPHTYTDVINAGTTLTGTLSSVTSDSAQFTVNLVADGVKAYDLVVTWLGGTGSHIVDTGGGSFADINNSGTLDYIAVTTGGTIGNITNAGSGVINGTETPYVDTDCCATYASSLSVDGTTVTGNITNNGTISQTSDANNVAGILIANASNVGGSITNNGQIAVTSSGNNTDAFGIFIDDIATVSGDVVNGVDGTITATAGSSGGADGIFNFGTTSGNLTNIGTITATAGNSGFATGVENVTTITDNLTNSGTITGMSGIGGTTRGIENDGLIGGNLTNSGTITATAADAGSAGGIANYGTITGSLTNGGTITGTSGIDGTTEGIVSVFTVMGDLTNSGTITATSGIGGETEGIENSGTIGNNLTNSGTITATAGNMGFAAGILNTGLITGGITNSGTITATATGGVALGIVNDNTITGGITNTGTITATGGFNTFAILSQGTGMTIDQNAGAINGDVGLSGADTFNINGGTVTGSITGNQASLGIGDAVSMTAGTLVLPPEGAIGNIASYTQSGGTLKMQVTSSSAPFISATAITLGGALIISPQGSRFGPTTTYTDVIIAGSSLSVAFSSITTDATGFSASLTPDGSLGEDLVLTYAPVLSNPGAAANIGQGAIAARGASAALTNTVQQRMVMGSDYDTSGLTLMNYSSSGNGNIHMMVAGLDGAPIPSSMPEPSEGSFWMRGFGSFSSAPGQGSASPFNQTRAGMVFGGDKRIDSHWTAGAAFQYAHTDLDFTDGSGSSRLDSYDLIAYGGWHDGPLYANGAMGAGWDHYNDIRNISSSPSATGSFNGQSYTASAETGYALPQQYGWTPTPYAGLGYTRVNTAAFTEDGAGSMDIAYQGSGSNSLTSTLGVRLATTFDVPDNGSFVPEMHLGWQHEYLDEAQTVNAAFTATPGQVFSGQSARFGRDTALAGLAITHPFSTSGKLFLTYDASITGGFTEHAVSGGVRWEF